MTPQHVHGTHAGSARRCHGWCRAIIDAILYLKQSCTRRDTPCPRARRQNIQTGVVKNVIYDTAGRSRHGPRISSTPSQLRWHGVELPLKLSYTRNGRALDEIHTWYPPTPAAWWSLRAVYLSTSMSLFTVVVVKPMEKPTGGLQEFYVNAQLTRKTPQRIVKVLCTNSSH